jgi:hypothetical protein
MFFVAGFDGDRETHARHLAWFVPSVKRDATKKILHTLYFRIAVERNPRRPSDNDIADFKG